MNPTIQALSAADSDTLHQQVNQQAKLLNGILGSVQCGIMLAHPIRDDAGEVIDFRVTVTNRRMAELTRFTEKQMLTRTMLELDPKGKNSGIFQQFMAALTHDGPVELEHYFDGTDVWLLQTLTPYEGGVLVSMIDISDQKRAQLAQQKQAELLQAVVDNVQVGIGLMTAVRDGTNRIVDFRWELTNEANARMTRLPVAEMIGARMTHLLPDTIESGFLDMLIQVVKTGHSTQLEFPYFYDGVAGWFDVRLVRQGDGILFSSLDITKRKLGEQAAEQQAELLRSVLDGSQNGIIAFDAIRNEAGAIVDFRYALQNEANRRRVGRTDEEILSHTMLEFFPDTAQIGLLEQYIQVVETGNPLRLERKFSYKNQSGWFDYSVVKRGDGLVMTVQDKTSEKNAQLAVKRQTEFLQTVIDTSPAGIITYKAIRAAPDQPVTDFVVTLANVGGAQLVGRQHPEAFIGRLMSDLFPSDEGRAFFAEVAEVAETGVAKTWLLPYFSDGIEGWFNISLIQQDDQVVATFLDVTDLKTLQQQLEQQNLDLRRSNESLQQFAYVASHDLQEPLRKINTFSQLLLTDHSAKLNADGQDMLRRMQNAAGRMSMLISDLLAYSRLSTQQAPFRPVSLPILLSRVIDNLEIAIREANATLTIGELPTVNGDVFQLMQLFQNLLSNAIKFRRTPALGEAYQPHIQVHTERVTINNVPESLRLQYLLPSRNIPEKDLAFHEISVSDNGIGFDEKYAERIFQVFQRLHGKGQFPGSGVGLAICRKVVDNHKGAITVNSHPGTGTTFRVYLPV
jgi:signal transduction histidine kinase